MSAPTSFELWLAPAASGQTGRLLDKYRQVLRQQSDPSRGLPERRRALWLAPTQAAASDLRERLARDRNGAWLDPGIMTFAGFAASVMWDAGLRLRLASRLQRRRLLRQVIGELAAEGRLEYFQAVAQAEGLVALVDETIADLKRRDVSADSFRRSAARGGARRKNLAEIYSRYQARLDSAALVDAEGLFQAARRGVADSREVAANLQILVIDGFTDFTTAQLQIIEVLASRTAETYVTLLAGGGSPGAAGADRADLFARPRATAEALRKLGAAAVRSPRPAGDWPALAHLERNLFRSYADMEQPPADALRTCDRIRIVAASGVQAEIEEIARRVKRLLLAGAAPEDVVVAFRSTNDVADRVRQVFDDFGIPAHVDHTPRLAASPLVRSLATVLRLAVEDWPYRRLMQAAANRSLAIVDHGPQSPPAWSSESRHSLSPRTAVELCVRHAQLPHGRLALLNQLDAWEAASVDRPASPSSPVAAAIPAKFVLGNIAKMLDGLPARGDIAAWIDAVEQLAKGVGLLGKRAAPESAACWSALSAGLWNAAQLDDWTGGGRRELSLAEFVELVTITAAELPAPGGTNPVGRVRVLSAEAARFTRPKHLLLGALSEQAFPAIGAAARDGEPPADSDGPDDSRRAEHRAGEMLLFYQLVTRPTESLTLSYPALDAKAQPMPASLYLVELERCFGEEVLQRTVQPLNYRAAEQDSGVAPLSRSDLRRTAVLRGMEGQRELLAALQRTSNTELVGPSILAGLEAVASRSRREFGDFEGVFASDNVRVVLERKFHLNYLWSPSHLETYAGCPFRFFGERVLELQPAPELALASDPARRGTLLHDTLAAMYGRLSQLPAGEPVTPALVASHFHEALSEVMKARPASGLDAALREIERRQIDFWAEPFAEQHRQYGGAWPAMDEPLTPRHFEFRFGPRRRAGDASAEDPRSTDNPLVIAADGEQFRFRGQIDRIDVGRVGDTLVFNVIDYKTGAGAKVDPDGLATGRQLQLPLYALAAAELLFADQPAAPLAAGFWSVKGKGFDAGRRSGGPMVFGEVGQGGVQTSANWTDLRGALLARIREMVGAIRQGWFPVFNDDPQCGQFCPFNTVCRINHVRNLEKQWSPPSAVGARNSPPPSKGGDRGGIPDDHSLPVIVAPN